MATKTKDETKAEPKTKRPAKVKAQTKVKSGAELKAQVKSGAEPKAQVKVKGRAKAQTKAMPKVRSERLDLRLAPEVKQEIERAAALSGQSLSNFVLGAAVPRAREVLREADVIRLTARDRDRFLAALDRDDAEPNAALTRAAERYKAATR